jgi:hypothetical protein
MSKQARSTEGVSDSSSANTSVDQRGQDKTGFFSFVERERSFFERANARSSSCLLMQICCLPQRTRRKLKYMDLSLLSAECLHRREQRPEWSKWTHIMMIKLHRTYGKVKEKCQ